MKRKTYFCLVRRNNFLISIIFLLITYSCSNTKQATTNSNTTSIDTIDLAQPLPTIKYKDTVYTDSIKTILFRKVGLELSDPILVLNEPGQLELKFDELIEDANNFRYELIHCNGDWTKSELTQYDYIEGFIDNNINDFKFSFNAIQQYVHYTMVFPDENYSITKSGNYILNIYIDNKNNPALTRRFYVVDQQVNIKERIKQPIIAEFRNSHQEIDFEVNYKGTPMTNPYQDLRVVITQNDRWDNAIEWLKPSFIRDDRIIFDYQRENLFPGGKEFRHFSFRSLRYLSDRLRKIEQKPLADQVYVIDDQVKAFKNYIFEKDINGRFIIEVQEGLDNHLEADYADIHFNLPFRSMLTNGDLYLFGAMTDWDIKEEFKLHFDHDDLSYKTSIYLKQGYYEYYYVFVEDKGALPQEGLRGFDETLIEGSKYSAENDYKIFVYYRPITERYDQLIGLKSFNTLQTFR